MFNITFSLALVYASTWLVVNVAPEVGAWLAVCVVVVVEGGPVVFWGRRECGGGGKWGIRLLAFCRVACCRAAIAVIGMDGVAESAGRPSLPGWMAALHARYHHVSGSHASN